jgi:hypothetical protein
MSFWHGDCHTPQWEHNDPTTKGSTQLRSTRSARPRHSCATHERARGACRECQKNPTKAHITTVSHSTMCTAACTDTQATSTCYHSTTSFGHEGPRSCFIRAQQPN